MSPSPTAKLLATDIPAPAIALQRAENSVSTRRVGTPPLHSVIAQL